MSIAEDWWRPFWSARGVEVTHVDLRADAGREAVALSLLDSGERAQQSRYLHPGSRRRFALSRAALRTLVGRRLGCASERIAFDASAHGKPFALVQGVPADISFNISHSGDHGLIALAPTGRLGVDVEERSSRHDLDGPIADVLGPDERTELAKARGDRKVHMFFRLWTIKEALIKALGTGHHTDVSAFQVPANMRGGEASGEFRFLHLPDVTWRLDDLGNSEFAAALAHELLPATCSAPDSVTAHLAI